MTDINITEIIEDRTSQFNIKKFSIGNAHFNRPEKSLDTLSLTRDRFDSVKNIFKFREGSRVINTANTILNLYSKYDNQSIQQFFYKKNWYSHMPGVLNFTFNFNPLNRTYTSALNGFFDYYHSFSELLLTVPNIRIEKSVKKTDAHGKERFEKQQVIDLPDYINFVESSFNYLNTKNTKPIFVPISLRMKLGSIKELVANYLKNEHYYFWIDFDGRSINQQRVGVLRHINNILRESGYYNKSIFYFTNVKREILVNAKNDASEASDVLSSLTGANIIGVNREPGVPIIKKGPVTPVSSSEISQDPTLISTPATESTENIIPSNYKARILNRDTYYYIKTNNSDLFDKNQYVPLNALRLNSEFESQTNHFLTNMTMRDYLNKKKMLTSYQDGNLLRELVSKEAPKKSLIDFL